MPTLDDLGLTREQAVQEMGRLQAELARRRLLAFTSYTYPGFVPYWHHKLLVDKLEDIISGRIQRLMIFMPPQHGKTELASRRLPAYMLGRWPDLKIVFGTYNSARAQEVSREVQRIIDGPEYRLLFPGTRLASGKDVETRTASRFNVVGRDGYYIAAGVGQGIAGKSMDIGIVDDPVASRADAESPAYRKAVWDWWINDITKRQVSYETKMILVQTRWHEDDLAGRLLRLAAEDPQADQWEVVRLTGICEEIVASDPRAIGDALWPERFPLAFLQSQRAQGAYEFASLYQQSPVPPGGAMAKREWFVILPARMSTGGVLRWVRAWDLAATEAKAGTDPDWTVGTLLGQGANGQWLVADSVRIRASPNEVDMLMLQTARMDGRYVMIREEMVGGSGKAVVAAHAKMFAGYDYKGVLVTGEKTSRWRPFFSQAEAGNVLLNPGPWNKTWLDEITMVPFGCRHDDQADAVSLAFNELTSHVDYGPTVAAVLPRGSTGQVSDGEWRRRYFS